MNQRPHGGVGKIRGQNAAEYVVLLASVLAAFTLLHAVTGGAVAEKLSSGLSDQVLTLLTLLRLPF